MSEPITMLCIYTPQEGAEEKFFALLENHYSTLAGTGLVTDKPAKLWRATDKNGRVHFIERFQWKETGSSDIAHQTPEVMSIWEPMGAIADNMQFLQIEPVE